MTVTQYKVSTKGKLWHRIVQSLNFKLKHRNAQVYSSSGSLLRTSNQLHEWCYVPKSWRISKLRGFTLSSLSSLFSWDFCEIFLSLLVYFQGPRKKNSANELREFSRKWYRPAWPRVCRQHVLNARTKFIWTSLNTIALIINEIMQDDSCSVRLTHLPELYNLWTFWRCIHYPRWPKADIQYFAVMHEISTSLFRQIQFFSVYG